MKTVKLLYLIAWCLLFQPVVAQYTIDWQNAPANPIPIAHTKNHFNLKGDIQTEKVSGEWGYEYVFDQRGNLILSKSSLLGDIQYVYDANGKLLKSVSKSKYGDVTEVYSIDSNGRVIGWNYSDNSGGARFGYNHKGLWETTHNLNGELTQKKYYDSQNRIIKTESYKNGAVSYVSNYTYSYEGGKLKVIRNSTTIETGKSSSLTDYYEQGNNLYSKNNLTLVYDNKGNWYQKIDSGSKRLYSTRELSYHDGTSSGGSPKGNTPQTPSAPNSPNSPNSPVTTNDCVSGDCQNGWGKKNYSYGYYEGFWKNGVREGYGFFHWTDAGNYIGFWQNDQLHGYGCYLGKKKNLIGEYRNGMMNGVGYTHELENDKWVRAVFKNYLPETEYTFYDNKVATGCVAGDCQNAYGRYKWSNGDSFTGFFRNGKMYMGTYSFSSGDKYEGMFNTNNQFHGQGRFFFKDNSYYGGEWQNGVQEGLGYFHDSGGLNKKIGQWSNGKLIKSYQ
ncbi:MAG: hypothetical protein CL596_02790 [Alteromonas sp.]|nr:hypothetical protein [Alteromonas sp.]MAY23486.1 hypothetical protein [Flavobacteriaceae bacterium]|tara:strand:+ start:39716 stop:41218 length:1503 start_codon:yes stop_codon:yes gene_type:complete